MEEIKRKCLRCGTEMLENCYIDGSTIRGGRVTFHVHQDTGKLFVSDLGEPMFALCPNCGEISWYLKPVHLENLKK